MRCVGVDLGTVRIGIALSDSGGLIATPYEVLQRSKTKHDDHRKIAELVRSVDAEVVVVGLPLSLDGSENPACEQARQEADSIAAALHELAGPVPTDGRPNAASFSSVKVVLHDERFSTTEAERSLRKQKLNAPKRRQIVDKVAAAVFLQAWLDSQ